MVYTAAVKFDHENGVMYVYPTKDGTKEVDASKPYYKVQSSDVEKGESLVITHQQSNRELGQYNSTLTSDFKSKTDKLVKEESVDCPREITGNSISVVNCQPCKSETFNVSTETAPLDGDTSR